MGRRFLLLISLIGLTFLAFFVWRMESSDISPEQKKYLDEYLNVLSEPERDDLEYIFDYFFFFDSFAYPVFGTKPMSFARIIDNPQAERGWSAWNRICEEFQSEKFVLGEFTFDSKPFVLLANLDLIEKAYEQNEDLFVREEITLVQLKESLRKRDALFFQVLERHELLGILLGYGRTNALLFKDREKSFPLVSFGKTHPLFIYLMNKVCLPTFLCDPNSEETKALRSQYQADQSKISKLGRSTLFRRMLLRLKGLY